MVLLVCLLISKWLTQSFVRDDKSLTWLRCFPLRMQGSFLPVGLFSVDIVKR